MEAVLAAKFRISLPLGLPTAMTVERSRRNTQGIAPWIFTPTQYRVYERTCYPLHSIPYKVSNRKRRTTVYVCHNEYSVAADELFKWLAVC